MDQDRHQPETPDSPSTLDLSGRCVGSSFILVRPLGQGATGTVWRGVDRSSGEPVAVKLLHDSLVRQPKLVTRFVQERTILLMLRHRNVVRVRDLFSVGESLALVMDLVAGGSLRQHLRHGPLAPAAAARIGAQIAAALAEAHGLGIVHRDLKPDNVLLADGAEDVRLTDFGIARLLHTPGLTTTNAVIGTPHYMSPEAFQGAPADPAADIYSLGVLLYELICGRLPYDSDSIAGLMELHLQGRPERRPGIPDALWDIIRACMDAARLRPSAAELVHQLAAAARTAQDQPALPPPAAPQINVERSPHPSLPGTPKLPAPRRRNQPANWRWARPWGLVAMVSGAMLASGVATTAWHFTHDTTAQPATLAQPPLVASTAPSPSAPAAAPARKAKPVTLKQRDRVAATTPEQIATVRPKPAPTRTARSPIPEAATGPWVCPQQWSIGRDAAVLMIPCHQLGEGVQIRARLMSPRDGTAALSVALQNVESGRTTGARTCDGLGYGRGEESHECGPVTVSPEHGHRYRVVMSWRFARQGRISTGSAKGSEFGY